MSYRTVSQGCRQPWRPPPLDFVYLSDTLAVHAQRILETLRTATRCPRWIGTVGLGICATGIEYYNQPALSVMLCDFPEDSFRTFQFDQQSMDSSLTAQADWLARQATTFSVVHCDPRVADLTRELRNLSVATGDGFLVGGVASSRDQMIQYADGVSESLLSGVIFGDSVRVSTRLTQGCSPLGDTHEITECQGNIIAKLDDRPALDVMVEEIGEVLARNLQRVGQYIFAGLPILGSDTGDYLVRNLSGFDPAQRLVAIAAPVNRGDRLLFCRRDSEAAYQDLQRMVAEIRPSTGPEPRGALYFSCVARGEAQFGPGSKELGVIRESLGDVPVVGFFGNGEISGDRLYAYTGVLSLFF